MFHESDSNQPRWYHWHVGLPHQSIGTVHEWLGLARLPQVSWQIRTKSPTGEYVWGTHSACIFAEVVTINDGLMSLADGLPMCHITCRHNHVTVKGKLSRCHLKSGMVGTVHCPLYSQVCHITCWHNHVMVKGKLSGCHLKSGMVGTVHCPLYSQVQEGHGCWILANELSSMDIRQRDWSGFAITWWVHSRMALVWGLAIVAITALIP